MTIAELIGMPTVIEQQQITEHQYKSKFDNTWHKCGEWEIPKYEEYYYETRIFTYIIAEERFKSFYELALGL